MEKDSRVNAAMGNNRPPLILTFGLYALFFAYALSVTMIGPLIPVIMNQYRIVLSESGLITLILGTGGILSVVAGALVSDLFRKSLLVKLAAFVYSLSLILMAFSGSYAVFLILYFFLGASTRLLDAVVNAYVSDIHVEKRGFYMNMLHASFALGAVAGPLITSALLTAGFPWHFVYLALGVFCLAVSSFYFTVQTRVKNETVPLREKEARNISPLLKSGRLMVLCAMAFLYTGISSVFSTWMPSFFMQELKTDAFFAGLPGSVYWLGILAGRLTYSFISEKFSTKSLLLTSNIFAGIVLVLAIIVNTPAFYLAALFVAGFLCSAVIPFSVALGCTWYPKNTGTVSSMIFFFATSGYMLLPFLYGAVADSSGLYFSIVLTAILPLAIAVSASLLPAEKKSR
jgi:fucose permease